MKLLLLLLLLALPPRPLTGEVTRVIVEDKHVMIYLDQVAVPYDIDTGKGTVTLNGAEVGFQKVVGQMLLGRTVTVTLGRPSIYEQYRQADFKSK